MTAISTTPIRRLCSCNPSQGPGPVLDYPGARKSPAWILLARLRIRYAALLLRPAAALDGLARGARALTEKIIVGVIAGLCSPGSHRQ